MEFPWLSKKKHVKFPVVNEKRSGISKRDQEKVALLDFRTPLLLLMIHHEETRLNANRNPNPNPQGGTKVQQRRKSNVEFQEVLVFGRGISEGGSNKNLWNLL